MIEKIESSPQLSDNHNRTLYALISNYPFDMHEISAKCLAFFSTYILSKCKSAEYACSSSSSQPRMCVRALLTQLTMPTTQESIPTPSLDSSSPRWASSFVRVQSTRANWSCR